MELIDVVDNEDAVIGTMDRNELKTGFKNIRGVDIFLLLKDNRIVVPKRTMDRRIFPGCYDYSVGGIVDSGEDYETSAYREMMEEVSLNIPLTEIGYFNPYKEDSKIFNKLYVGYIDDYIKEYDRDGIENIYYLTIDEIDKLLTEVPHLFKSNYRHSFSYFKEWLNKNKTYVE